MKIAKKNIPNLLTVIRGFLTIIILFMFVFDFSNKYIWIYALFFLASFTDFLDGYLARKWKVVSEFGKIFDPLFDKILILGIFMMLIPLNIIPPLLLVLLFIREITVDNLKAYMASCGEVVQAIKSGKIKMILQTLMLNFVFLGLIFPQLKVLHTLVFVLTILSVFFAYWSAAIYSKRFLSFLKKRMQAEN